MVGDFGASLNVENTPEASSVLNPSGEFPCLIFTLFGGFLKNWKPIFISTQIMCVRVCHVRIVSYYV